MIIFEMLTNSDIPLEKQERYHSGFGVQLLIVIQIEMWIGKSNLFAFLRVIWMEKAYW
jgi:hypothetical protein